MDPEDTPLKDSVTSAPSISSVPLVPPDPTEQHQYVTIPQYSFNGENRGKALVFLLDNFLIRGASLIRGGRIIR